MSTHHHHENAATVNPSEAFDWDAMATMLERRAELRTPFLTAALDWLGGLAPAAGRVLDVGSGPGVVTCLLAHRFPGARVTAVDGAPAQLERVRDRAAGQGLAERVDTHRADLPAGFATLDPADVVWAGQVVHHLGDQQAALAALARTLRPGGVLAIVEGGLTQRFLPRDFGLGRPGFQARLEAAEEDWFASMRTALPGSAAVVEDWPALLSGAGLVPTGSRTFLTDLPAPLGGAARQVLRDHLARRREHMAEQLAPEDRKTLDHLLDDDSPAGILRRPDAFYLEAQTVHTARAALPS
ncbi:class I SAM-dependent methyltransferase [Streptomyces stramineus]